MVAVLLAAPRVAPAGLQMAFLNRANPDVRPSWRNRQPADARQSRRLMHQASACIQIAKPLAAPDAGQSGKRIRDVRQGCFPVPRRRLIAVVGGFLRLPIGDPRALVEDRRPILGYVRLRRKRPAFASTRNRRFNQHPVCSGPAPRQDLEIGDGSNEPVRGFVRRGSARQVTAPAAVFVRAVKRDLVLCRQLPRHTRISGILPEGIGLRLAQVGDVGPTVEVRVVIGTSRKGDRAPIPIAGVEPQSVVHDRTSASGVDVPYVIRPIRSGGPSGGERRVEVRGLPLATGIVLEVRRRKPVASRFRDTVDDDTADLGLGRHTRCVDSRFLNDAVVDDPVGVGAGSRRECGVIAHAVEEQGHVAGGTSVNAERR